MKVVYGSSRCSACKVLVSKLERDNEEFQYIDIDTLTSEQINTIVELEGTTSLPIVIEGDKLGID